MACRVYTAQWVVTAHVHWLQAQSGAETALQHAQGLHGRANMAVCRALSTAPALQSTDANGLIPTSAMCPVPNGLHQSQKQAKSKKGR